MAIGCGLGANFELGKQILIESGLNFSAGIAMDLVPLAFITARRRGWETYGLTLRPLAAAQKKE